MLDIVSKNCLVLQFFKFIKKLAQIDVLCIIASKYLVRELFCLFYCIINDIEENRLA